MLMVHAGTLPQWTVLDVVTLAREVESMLRSAGRDNFLRELYGDEPHAWNNALVGHVRPSGRGQPRRPGHAGRATEIGRAHV